MFELNDDDVISTEPALSLSSGSVFKTKEACTWVMNKFFGNHPHAQWYMEGGVACEVLQTSGGGWKKGRVRFRLEFIPDTPPESSRNSEKKDPFGNM